MRILVDEYMGTKYFKKIEVNFCIVVKGITLQQPQALSNRLQKQPTTYYLPTS